MYGNVGIENLEKFCFSFDLFRSVWLVTDWFCQEFQSMNVTTEHVYEENKKQ